uniref:DUF7662 domain-containing protein n=1 Tax=uncultured marine thaumarchaeote KM3_04_H06 TaxID=1455967 RepID=A0A075G3N5_9ARCH|nr:hypothetical protein [uncultured marine thaumarchaeote KM3_04_H06]
MGRTAPDYSPFTTCLYELHADEAEFSFSKIERILGHRLQQSAYKHKAWWSNSPTHLLMKQVLEVGWEKTKIDLRNKIVKFHRTGYPALVKLPKPGTKKPRKRGSVLTTKTILKMEDRFKFNRNNKLKRQTPDFTFDGKAIHFEHIVDDFASQISKGEIKIYNEASIQHELASFLRIIPNYEIQLERNVNYFKLNKKRFVKRDIDIVLFNKTKTRKFAIEIKYPTGNSGEPEQMYKFCEDLRFLEQLKESGFTGAFFLAITSNSRFWRNMRKRGSIYEKFRKEKELYGIIANPIRTSEAMVTLKGRHKINWLSINNFTRYFVVRI